MEYTIRELADLSGVTTRTLRWYDQIGLLKPGRVAENGYRYYGAAQVDRLQDAGPDQGLPGRSLLRPARRPPRPPDRSGTGAGPAGGADSVGTQDHFGTGKEGTYERSGEI